jgi:hypothetical protein
MSLSVVPHAAGPTKHGVLTVATTATVPAGECFGPSTLGVGKTLKFRLNRVGISPCAVAIATAKSD